MWREGIEVWRKAVAENKNKALEEIAEDVLKVFATGDNSDKENDDAR